MVFEVSGGSESVEDVFLGWIEADLVELVLEVLINGLVVRHRGSAHLY